MWKFDDIKADGIISEFERDGGQLQVNWKTDKLRTNEMKPREYKPMLYCTGVINSFNLFLILPLQWQTVASGSKDDGRAEILSGRPLKQHYVTVLFE